MGAEPWLRSSSSTQTCWSMQPGLRRTLGLLIADALIAATAISTRSRFITKNQRDYRCMAGLALLPYPRPFNSKA
ncbi:MAG: hypothetical protein AB1714_30110 [Acidobacteriota bacterium]